MKQLLIYMFLLLLLTVSSCNRELYTNQSQQSSATLIAKAKAYTESQMKKGNGEHFYAITHIQPNWNSAYVDTLGNVRVPTIKRTNAVDIIEFYLKPSADTFTGHMIQFIPRTKDYLRILFTLQGEKISKLQVDKEHANYFRRWALQAYSSKTKLKRALQTFRKDKVLDEDGDNDGKYDEYIEDLFNLFDSSGTPAIEIFLMTCPSGLYFNPETCICDFLANIQSVWKSVTSRCDYSPVYVRKF